MASRKVPPGWSRRQVSLVRVSRGSGWAGEEAARGGHEAGGRIRLRSTRVTMRVKAGFDLLSTGLAQRRVE